MGNCNAYTFAILNVTQYFIHWKSTHLSFVLFTVVKYT